MTRRRLLAGLLTLIMVLQALVPGAALAKSSKPLNDNLITIGKLTKKDYPQIDKDTALRVAREQKNKRKGFLGRGATLFSADSPYITGQQPGDADKPKYLANITGKVEAKGLDRGNFDWNKIFGDKPIKLELRQLDKTKLDKQTNPLGETGLILTLEVSKAGEFKLTDRAGNLTDLPLFSAEGNPFEYQIQVDRKSYENVELIISTNAGTPGSKFEQVGEKQIATLSFTIGIQQLASTKFTSEWHTGVAEADRPQIEGYFKVGEDLDNDFNFPKNDTTRTILRSGFLENFVEDEENGPWAFIDSELEAAPESVEVKTDTAGLIFDTTKKTVTSGDHKYNYDFTYDVIKGGKLTMTEIIPVTFDANGGKFASITDPNAEQKIVKEVEYDGTLTDKAEAPTKDRETFKGWSETKGGTTPVTDDAFKNITKSKTLYAIWDKNDIVADQLEVKESFKDGDTWVNAFIPSLDTLKGQVKIKDAKGVPQPLTNDDKLQILDDDGNPIADTDLKDKLYEKLKEDDTTEVSRDVILKAKVTVNGTSQTVEIPIKVIKNIYKANTDASKPSYVPDGYVKVTVDPTMKAKDPQKYTYYVNPAAKVVIPGEDPEGTGDNQFVKWTMKADTATGDGADYALAERHKFTEASTVTAQYVSDVIPQEGTDKPSTVPSDFVSVTFVPTDNGTMEGPKIFWVNPDKKVTLPVKNPVGKQYFTFKEWKIGDVNTGETYKVGTPKQFTNKNGTTITATYTEAENIIPYDPSVPDPMVRPVGYVRVTFAADPGLKLTEQKAYYVKKNAKDAQGQALTLASLTKPGYEAQTGYKFEKWDKKDDLVIEAPDIVVTAKATKLDNVIPEEKEDGTPNEKPKGYKTVTFVVKTGDESKGSIKGVTKFYVNPNEYVKITPPATEAKTGYVFGSWGKDTTIPTVYKADTTITGSFNELGAVIPKTNPDGTENKQPAGYVRVNFMAIGEGYIPTGETRVYFVNPEKKVTITPPKAKGNTGYEFNKWNLDTTKPTNYPTNMTVTGSFKKLEDIIPSTDGDGKPNPKPEGYVTVTFSKGDHGKDIKGQTVYYVNPKAVPTKKLGDESIVKPTVTPEIGYTFVKWSIGDSTLIKNNQRPIAEYKELPDVISKNNPAGGENDKPKGYITVTFSTEKNGKIKNSTETTKLVYVNPNKAVALDKFAPQVDPNTGFTFADWDTSITKAIQYKDGDVIKAKYNPIGAVIPKKSDDTEKPAGYVTVTFDKGMNGKSITGTTVYYVDPNKEVTVPAPTVTPETGWKQKTGDAAWDQALTQKFTAENTTITAQYEEIGDVIPQVNTDGSDKPNGYVTVKFVGKNGTLSGTTTYYVNGEKEVDLTNTAKAITKNPNVGYTAEGGTWDKPLKAKFKDGDVLTFTFKEQADVIEVTPGATQPDGYVTVKLIPTGKATDATKAEKTYWVNPKKEVTIPSTNPVGKKITDANDNTYTFTFKEWTSTSGIHGIWKPGDEIKGIFTQETDITAKYNVKAEKLVNGPIAKDNVVTPKDDVPKPEDLIGNPYDPKDPTNKDNLPDGTTFKYTNDGTPDVTKPGETTAKVEVKYPNGKTVVVEVPIKVVDHVVPQTGKDKPNVPANYVKVTFVIDPAGGGTIADGQTTIYYVNPKQDVTIDPPQTKAETGYSFAGWNPNTKEAKKYESDTTVKGSFTKGNDIIPATNEEGKSNDKPEGYVTVTFDKGEHGKEITGETTYYVNPKADPAKTLGEITKPTVTPDTGFTANGWDTEDTTEIKSDITVTARYNPIDDVIPKTKDDESEKPDGYVTVTFNTTDVGGNVTKVVFVNPKKAVVLSGFEPKGFEVKKGYEFAGWDISINQGIQYKDGTVITALYNNPNDISTKEIDGYVKVEFKPGEHGSLSGPTTYWVKPGAEVYLPSPTVKANDGYRFDKWDKSLKVKFDANAPTYFITAQYEKQKPVDPTPDLRPYPVPGDCNNRCDQPNQPNQPNVGKDALNTTDHYQYLIGYPDGNFAPNKGMTRAEAATMFTRLLRERPIKWRHYNAGLNDIRPGDWYADTVGYAVQRGIVSGYPDGSFKPNKPITRAEFAAIASRFDALAQGNAISFSDLAPSHWGYNAIRSAATKGWISGYPDNTFRPEQAITRAEVTAITNRMLNRHADLYWIDAHPSEVIRFGDVKRSDWYFEPIMEATMGHDFIRDRDKKTEHWTGINGKSFI